MKDHTFRLGLWHFLKGIMTINMPPPQPSITSFTLELSLGATMAINGNEAWVKPAATVSTTWSGIPSQDQINLAYDFMMSEILNPSLKEISEAVIENTKKAKGL